MLACPVLDTYFTNIKTNKILNKSTKKIRKFCPLDKKTASAVSTSNTLTHSKVLKGIRLKIYPKSKCSCKDTMCQSDCQGGSKSKWPLNFIS